MLEQLSRLNGWQRLWLIFSIISLILTVIITWTLQQKTTAVEDTQTLALLNADEVVRVDGIPFPNSMNETEIRHLIRKYYNNVGFLSDDGADSIRQLAANLMANRNEGQAANGKQKNSQVRRHNLQIVLYGLFGWILLTFTVYALGYSVGWIYHGFKKT